MPIRTANRPTTKKSEKTATTSLLLAVAVILNLSACEVNPPSTASQSIRQEMRLATQAHEPSRLPSDVDKAIRPSLEPRVTPKGARSVDPRFDLVMNDAPVREVFMALVADSRYSLLLDPRVEGRISVHLKDVTIREALEAIRDQYGYDYRIEGNRIHIQPNGLQTRFYTVSYLPGRRTGKTGMSVASTVLTSAGSNNNGTSNNNNNVLSGSNQSAGNVALLETSRLDTLSESDFWSELKRALENLIGCSDQPAKTPSQNAQTSAKENSRCPEGRSVTVNPQAGLIVVNAFPQGHKLVADYLRAAQLIVDRQVMIEAKIIEVVLNEGAQTGINWSYVSGSFGLGKGAGLPLPDNKLTSGLFTLGIQSRTFNAILQFLQTQGTVHVLSSPRIAVVNNQKAVLKVGTDEFYVTGVNVTSTSNATSTTTIPNVILTPFFSGVALDIMPQIDDQGYIVLHVHPSVTTVTEVTKQITVAGQQSSLPLATTSVSESDSIVRLKDGEIAVIGGLMRVESRDATSKVPGIGDVPLAQMLFKNTDARRVKSELVILLKPTVIRSGEEWKKDALSTLRRIDQIIEEKTP